MNRREAIAALTALPAAAVVTTVKVEPNDVIVIECDSVMSQATADRIKAHVEQVWPGHKVLVLGDGLKLKIAKGGW